MKRTLTVTVILAVIGFSTVADAAEAQLRPKAPGTATALSLGGTVAPLFFGFAMSSACSGPSGCSPVTALTGFVAVTGGSIFGPGLGHLYAGRTGHFWAGAGLRTAGFGGAILAFALSWDNPDSGTAAAGFAVGMGLWLGSSLYDMATASRSAREYNHKHGLDGLSISPTIDFDRGGAGVKLAWKF